MKQNVFYRKWEVEHPQATLYIVHGLGEHSGRYEHVAQWFNTRGVAVYSGDLPGFGQTPGQRGHVDSFETILDAIDQGWKRMVEEHPNLPHFLLGHSMGGLLVTEYLLTMSKKTPMTGVIITSPGYRPVFEIPAWKNALANLLTPLVPSLALPSGLPVQGISRDPEVVHNYQADPHTHDKVSLRFYQEMNRVMKTIYERVSDFPADLPVYWMTAGADQLVNTKATKEFYDLLQPHPMRKYKEWPDLYHEIMNEPEKEEVLSEIWSFMQDVMKEHPTSNV